MSQELDNYDMWERKDGASLLLRTKHSCVLILCFAFAFGFFQLIHCFKQVNVFCKC